MAQPHDRSDRAVRLALPADALKERLQRYLPHDLAAATIAELGQPDAPAGPLARARADLSAARATIATYLPHLLLHQLLDERLESPWLRWVEGSLLFADLSGSTALAERLGALGREGTELVTDFLNHIFATMIQVVHEYGGDIMAFGGDLVSFGGDALLIFFGDDQHPHTAVRTALALQKALHGYVCSVPGVGVFPMHLHVGVESGPVAFVSVGHAHTLHYSLLGQTVNHVAVAEGLAGPGEVVAGPGTWAWLGAPMPGAEVAPGFARLLDPAPALPHPPRTPSPAPSNDSSSSVDLSGLLDDLDRMSPYIPPMLLKRILADPRRPQVEADLRPVTALFAQGVGLEVLAEALPPELAARAVQAYVATMQAAVERFGGMLNKLDVADEGVRLVAVFGAPTAYEDHAERAARAALEMQDRLDDVNRQLVGLLRERPEDQNRTLAALLADPSSILKQRVGLNLGTVFAGNVGSHSRKEYTVMGDAVNVAARVMGAADWGEVWCGEAVAQATGGRIVCRSRGRIALKGKSAALALFQLCGEGERPGAGTDAGQGPLIGRAEELGWLREQLRAAMSGAGRAARVAGPAGIGKTRLVAALVDHAVAQGVRVIPAVCLSYAASIPYAAWSEWLKALCGIVSGDDDARRNRKLADRLAGLGPGMADWLPLLGDLVRLDVADNRLTRGLDPQMRQTRRFELLQQLLLRAADDGPVLALFENLHWADPISLDLWRRVAGSLDGRPVLLLGLHRPFSAGDGAQVLDLQELSSEESDALLRALMGDLALPDVARRQIVERAAGNPLFLAELLRVVQLKMPVAGWQPQGLSPGIERQTDAADDLQAALDELPDSLQGLLLARIDRLDESSRSVLRVASVIGQRIPMGVLQAIQPVDRQVLQQQLASLDAEELTLLERLEPERVHTFRQALVQEVAYQSMLYARRRELHGRIGAYLERRYASDLDDYYGLLAHHYRLSDQHDKAIEYLLKAGHAARAVYANEEALRYYRWALEALGADESDPRMWEARDALGDVYATIGRYDDALAQHAAILAAPGVTAEAARRAHRKRGSVFEKQGQYAAALEELGMAMAIARSGAAGLSPLAIPTISADIGLVHRRRGEYDLAIAACEEGLRFLRRDLRARDDELIEARLHSELGGIYGMRGDYPRARHHLEHSLRVRESIDDLPGMIASHNNLGYLWQLQSEYERAIEHYRVAEDLARKINLRYTLVFAAGNLAYALISMGAYGEAEARCVEAIALANELKAQDYLAQAHNTLGIVYYHTGAYERALAAFDEALRLNRALGSVYQEHNTLMHMALALNAQGRYDEASTAAATVLDRAEALHAQRLKVEALNALAEAALGQGAPTEATAQAAAAAELGRAIGSKHDEGIARRLLGQAAAARNLPFATDFDASIALFESARDRFELGRTWAAYGFALVAAGNQSAGRAYLQQAHDAFVAIGASGQAQRLASLVERST